MKAIRYLAASLLTWIALSSTSIQAMEIADGFTYGNESGFAASHALATDYVNFPEFQAVGLLLAYEGESARYHGTATLLNKDWLLTAGHNWNASTTSMEFVIGGSTYSVDMNQRYQHPLWQHLPVANPTQGWDIALIRLTTSVTDDIVFPQLYTKSDELNQTSIILGAGILGTGTQPWEPQSDKTPLVHAAYNVVDRVISHTETLPGGATYTGGFLVNDFDGSDDPNQNTLGSIYYSGNEAWTWSSSSSIIFDVAVDGIIDGKDSSSDQFTLDNHILEGAMAPGDSGGPTFILDGSDWKIAGITSWGLNPWDSLYNDPPKKAGLYGDVNYATRVSQSVDWIYSIIPEPSVNGLLIFSAMLLLLCISLLRKFRSEKAGL